MSAAEQPSRSAPETTATQRVEELVEVIQHARQLLERGDLQGGLSAFRQIAPRQPHPTEAPLETDLPAPNAAESRPPGAAPGCTPGPGGKSPNPLCERGLKHLQAGNNLGALEDFRRAVALAPDDPDLYNNIGVICFELGRHEEARSAFEQAVEVDAEYLAARLNLIDLDLALDRIEEARNASHELLDRTNDPEPALKLAECALRSVEQVLELALDDCRKALRHGPQVDRLRLACRRLGRAKAALTIPAEG